MIEHVTVSGHPAVYLDNGRLRIGVLPTKGADIFEFIYTPEGDSPSIQFLMQSPWGLRPPGVEPQSDFLDNYEGGWQELFPNANDACSYNGRAMPFHGEVALLPWSFKEVVSHAETVVQLSVTCQRTPFRLEREMRLPAGEGRLIIREQVTNVGSEAAQFVWGHHITLGGDFLEDGCRLETPARRVHTPDVLYEPLTAKLRAAQTSAWPSAESRDGTAVDLSYIPGPDSRSHDDVMLDGLERGYYRVFNPRLGLSFSLQWDVSVFPWLMFWQPYGGADLPPLTGIYGVGLEPWVSRYPLGKAIEEGQAHCLQEGESLETELVASIDQIAD